MIPYDFSPQRDVLLSPRNHSVRYSNTLFQLFISTLYSNTLFQLPIPTPYFTSLFQLLIPTAKINPLNLAGQVNLWSVLRLRRLADQALRPADQFRTLCRRQLDHRLWSLSHVVHHVTTSALSNLTVVRHCSFALCLFSLFPFSHNYST